jgi:hypothetical protein
MVDAPESDWKTRGRWLRLTPDRAVALLLAVEVFLILSDRFAWFAFQGREGWTVLIAVASAGAFLLLMLVWFVFALLFRRRFQFSMRSLLALPVVVALLGWLVVPFYHNKMSERHLVAAITKHHDAEVYYDYEMDGAVGFDHGRHPSAPAWIRRLVGDDMFGQPVVVWVSFEAPDDLLRCVGRLETLDEVHLQFLKAASEPFRAIRGLGKLTTVDLTDVPTDFHDLRQIPPMPGVISLSLSKMAVNDSICELIAEKFPSLDDLAIEDNYEPDENPEMTRKGLSVLRRLPHLKTLHVSSKYFTYADLAIFSGSELTRLCAEAAGTPGQTHLHIRDCPRLERLVIGPCLGAGDLELLKPSQLFLERTPRLAELYVENAESVRIEGACSLKKLQLRGCNVSAADFSRLVAGAPLIEVELIDLDGNVGALQHLSKIPSLRKLTLYRGELTDSDIRRLGSFRQLQELNLLYHERLDDRSLRQLEGLVNLRSLGVYGTRVTAAGVKRIESAIPGLRCVVEDPLAGMGGGGVSPGSK